MRRTHAGRRNIYYSEWDGTYISLPQCRKVVSEKTAI